MLLFPGGMNPILSRSWMFALLVLTACGLPDPSELPDASTSPKSSDRIFYTVGKVEGWYGGSADKVMSPTWIDSLSTVLCTFESSGTIATQDPFLGDPSHDAWAKGITIPGLARCPGALATSTRDDACSSKPLVFDKALLQWRVDIEGWADDSVVTLKASSPPTVQPSCNFASVLNGPGHLWELEARTTVGQFRAGKPFTVRFLGEKTLKFDGNTSQVQWDLTMTLIPKQ